MYWSVIAKLFETNDRNEIIRLSKKLPIALSYEEINQIKLLCKQFSFDWILNGVPIFIQQEVLKIIGMKKMKKLLQTIKQQ